MSIMLSKNIDICPLFTCKVSRRDIYYIKNYAEIIKICDILMTDFRAVWPRREKGVRLCLISLPFPSYGLFYRKECPH